MIHNETVHFDLVNVVNRMREHNLSIFHVSFYKRKAREKEIQNEKGSE